MDSDEFDDELINLHPDWAVLIAGSSGYDNYRHQADTHHAMKILMRNGMPRDRIIHMAYDDIASDKNNPYQGQIFNKPAPEWWEEKKSADLKEVNVYDKKDIDYSGKDVTA